MNWLLDMHFLLIVIVLNSKQIYLDEKKMASQISLLHEIITIHGPVRS